jgi:CheY-like chemotaxis protein
LTRHGHQATILATTGDILSILNVDDDAPARFLRSRILERAGFSVREADTAAQALAVCLSDAPPALVLLDVALSDGNGLDVCERIKTTRADLPVVLISAVYNTAHARRDGFHAGADEYLVAPVATEELISAVSRFLHPERPGSDAPLPMIVTDRNGSIMSANGPAARLLNVTARGLQDRSMLAFFAPGRERVASLLDGARRGLVTQGRATLRPRDRRPFVVKVEITAPFERGGALEWLLEPVED